MAKKLDAERIEQARQKNQTTDQREEEKRRIQDTIVKNRSGERKGHVIMPERKMYAYQEAPKVRVAAYCRVSTADEAQVGSFEMQVQHFKSVIENNPTYELVKIYTDEGISGTTLNKRKGFQTMIDDAVNGKIDLILTKSISRFGRNIVDILTTLHRLSDLDPPVAVDFESEGIFTSDGKNKLVISILSALAELESQQKSIAIKEGIHYRMQEGLYKFPVKNLIGYYRDYSGMLKIEPNEAQIVKYIYDSFLEGASPKNIAESITQQHIRSPMGMESWRRATIRSILSNEKYCGDVLYQKTFSKDYLSHKSVKNRDILPQWFWENNHPAIIKRENWIKAQELLACGKWSRCVKPLEAMKRKFTLVKVKSGVLCGFFMLDMAWTNDEREKFINIIKSINDFGYSQVDKE
jgi:Site-specific recombinases, DNA invertase Pin homologs